jgi:hypothetical protein
MGADLKAQVRRLGVFDERTIPSAIVCDISKVQEGLRKGCETDDLVQAQLLWKCDHKARRRA